MGSFSGFSRLVFFLVMLRCPVTIGATLAKPIKLLLSPGSQVWFLRGPCAASTPQRNGQKNLLVLQVNTKMDSGATQARVTPGIPPCLALPWHGLSGLGLCWLCRPQRRRRSRHRSQSRFRRRQPQAHLRQTDPADRLNFMEASMLGGAGNAP